MLEKEGSSFIGQHVGGRDERLGIAKAIAQARIDAVQKRHEKRLSIAKAIAQARFPLKVLYPSETTAAEIDSQSPPSFPVVSSNLVLSSSVKLTPIDHSEAVRNAAASQQPSHEFSPGLQVKPSLSPGQDIHSQDYYRGSRGSGPVLSAGLQTRPGPGDIHPRGYHTGGQGNYMPPQFRTGGGLFGR